VAEFLRRRLHQELPHLLFLDWDGKRLEQILQRDAHLPFRAADGLLEQLRKLRVRFLDFDLELEFVVVVEHGINPWREAEKAVCLHLPTPASRRQTARPELSYSGTSVITPALRR